MNTIHTSPYNYQKSAEKFATYVNFSRKGPRFSAGQEKHNDKLDYDLTFHVVAPVFQTDFFDQHHLNYKGTSILVYEEKRESIGSYILTHFEWNLCRAETVSNWQGGEIAYRDEQFTPCTCTCSFTAGIPSSSSLQITAVYSQ